MRGVPADKRSNVMEGEEEASLPSPGPPWPLPLPPQLPALRALATQAGAATFFHLWDQAAASSLAPPSSGPPIFSVVTVDDESWQQLLPPPPLPPSLLRRIVGAGLTATALSLTRPSSVRTVGGGTLVVEPGDATDPLTVNDQAAVRVMGAGHCWLIILERPLWRTEVMEGQ